MCTGASSDILADVSSEQYGLHCIQAEQVLLAEPKDCSHGEEQEEERSQETPESWISCSLSLFSPSLSSLCSSQTDSRTMDILFYPAGATTPWLVLGAGLGHSQHCSESIYSHFRGESSLNYFGTISTKLCFSTSLAPTFPFSFSFSVNIYAEAIYNKMIKTP